MERAVEGGRSPGTLGPDWLATALGFWSGRALAPGTAWADFNCAIRHHQRTPGFLRNKVSSRKKSNSKKSGPRPGVFIHLTSLKVGSHFRGGRARAEKKPVLISAQKYRSTVPPCPLARPLAVHVAAPCVVVAGAPWRVSSLLCSFAMPRLASRWRRGGGPCSYPAPTRPCTSRAR